MGTAHRIVHRRVAGPGKEPESELSASTAGLLGAVDAGLDSWSTVGWLAGRLLGAFREADDVEIRLGRPPAGRTEWGLRLSREGARAPMGAPEGEATPTPQDCTLSIRDSDDGSGRPLEHTMEGTVRSGDTVEAVLRLRCAAPGSSFSNYDLDLLAEMCGELGAVLRMARLRDALYYRLDPTDPLLREASGLSRRLPLLENVKFHVEQRSGDGSGVDFYDAFWVAPHRLAVAIGTARGEPSRTALVAAWAANRLRVAALGGNSPRPDRVVAAVRADLAAGGLGDARLDCLFLLVDLRTREAAYTSTGSESLMVWRRSVTGLTRIRHGLTERREEDVNTSAAVARLRLAGGDSMVLYSGGVVEAQDGIGRTFGLPHLEKSLASGANQRLSEMMSRAMSDLRAFIRGTRPRYDMTVLGVVLTATAPMTTQSVAPARSPASERVVSEREVLKFLGEEASRSGS